jgi:hypothetical protein
VEWQVRSPAKNDHGPCTTDASSRNPSSSSETQLETLHQPPHPFSPPPILSLATPSPHAIDTDQAEHDASCLADAFQHAFDGKDVEEDGDDDPDRRVGDMSDEKLDDPMDIDAPTASAKAWVRESGSLRRPHSLLFLLLG